MTVATIPPHASADAPEISEQTLQVWRAGDRVRDEYTTGSQAGWLGVRDARRWWLWSPDTGASTNTTGDSANSESGAGRQLAIVFNPARLLGYLHFEFVGHGEQAGRPALLVEAVPRVSDHHPLAILELTDLGRGADIYQLAFDAQRGVLLHSRALYDGKPFREITATAITFDRQILDDIFVFRPRGGLRRAV